MNKPKFAAGIVFLTFIASVTGYLACQVERPVSEVRVLAWTGYEEQEFLDLIRAKSGLNVRVKTYTSGNDMYNQFTTAPPGAFDVVVVDVEYGKKLSDQGRLQVLAYDDFDLEGYDPYFQDFHPARAFDLRKTFAIVVRWGTLGIAYNTEKVHNAPNSYNELWNPTYRGRVGIFDWYLPNMGVLSLMLGNDKPYDLDSEQFERLAEATASLGPQVGSIDALPSEVTANLKDGKTWIVPGVGEWAVAGLILEGEQVDWAIPREGGVLFVEGLAIPSDLPEARREAAARYIQTMTDPQVQAELAWRDAYQSQVANRFAYSLMTEAQRRALKVNSPADLGKLLAQVTVRELPSSQTETEWQSAWDTLKTAALRR